MDTPFIRAKAKDIVDALDNATAYSDSSVRNEVVEVFRSTLHDIQQVLIRAEEEGTSTVSAFQALMVRFDDYWSNPPA